MLTSSLCSKVPSLSGIVRVQAVDFESTSHDLILQKSKSTSSDWFDRTGLLRSDDPNLIKCWIKKFIEQDEIAASENSLMQRYSAYQTYRYTLPTTTYFVFLPILLLFTVSINSLKDKFSIFKGLSLGQFT